MGAAEPSVGDLLDRMGRELSAQLLPYFVVSIVDEQGGATRDEISERLVALEDGKIDFSQRSHVHLIGRLEKTFGLISQDAERDGVYVLTAKGRALFEATRELIMVPLEGMLLDGP